MARNSDERSPLLTSPRPDLRAPCAPLTSDYDDETAASSSCPRRCRGCLRSYVPIEPLLCGYTFSRVLVITLTGFYFYDVASHWHGDPSRDSLNPCGHGSSNSSADKEEARQVQKDSLELILNGNFCDFITAVIPTLFIGPAIDKLGRRLGFVLPLLGSIALAIVFLFVLVIDASVYYLYIGFVLEGLGGGFGTFFMTTFSAVADVETPGQDRALRICINEAVIVFSSALAGFVAGEWRRSGDYTRPVMVGAALGVVTFLYALWWWPETRRQQLPTDENATSTPQPVVCDYDAVMSGESLSDARRSKYANGGSSVMKSHSYSSINHSSLDNSSVVPAPESDSCLQVCRTTALNVRESWRVYFRSESTSHPARGRVLLLCIVCFLLAVAVNFSKPSVETIYRLGHLCWDAVYETTFDAGWLVSHWICILITLRVLHRGLHMTGPSLAMIGCVSAMAAPLLFSLATIQSFSTYTATVLVYVSAGSGTLARLLIPMLRSIASSVVSSNEQGALFSSYACVELSGAAVFSLAASQVYKVTVEIWPGIIFLIMTFFFLVVMSLLVILSRLWRIKPVEMDDIARGH